MTSTHRAVGEAGAANGLAPDAENLVLLDRLRANVASVLLGKPEVVSSGPRRPAGRGAPAHRGRARHRQDAAGQGPGPQPRLHFPPHPVHPRPAAQRPARHQRLPPGQRRRSSSSRGRCSPRSSSPTRSTGPRRAPSRPAGGDERPAGVGGRPDAPARAALLRAGHAEPLRVRGHLPAAGEPARPLPDAPARRLPRPRGRAAHPDRPPRRRAGRRPAAGPDRGGGGAPAARRRARSASRTA